MKVKIYFLSHLFFHLLFAAPVSRIVDCAKDGHGTNPICGAVAGAFGYAFRASAACAIDRRIAVRSRYAAGVHTAPISTDAIPTKIAMGLALA